MMSTDKIYSLEKEVAVINSKLDDIHRELKQLSTWMARHEVEHERIHKDQEDIRAEIRSSTAESTAKINEIDVRHASFTGKQGVINAIIGSLAGVAAGTIVTLLVTGALS